MSRDSAARPHELTLDKKQYAEILVNGKTGTINRFDTIHKRLDLAAFPKCQFE